MRPGPAEGLLCARFKPAIGHLRSLFFTLKCEEIIVWYVGQDLDNCSGIFDTCTLLCRFIIRASISDLPHSRMALCSLGIANCVSSGYGKVHCIKSDWNLVFTKYIYWYWVWTNKFDHDGRSRTFVDVFMFCFLLALLCQLSINNFNRLKTIMWLASWTLHASTV